MSPSPSVSTLPILAALRRWSLHTPTDGDGDEAVNGLENFRILDRRTLGPSA
jgi:hypothetical protein